MARYFEKTIVEEEFRKRRAKLAQEEIYLNRGSKPQYFSESAKSSQAIMKVINHHGRVHDLLKYVTDEKRTGGDEHIYDFIGTTLSRERLKEIESFWHKRNKQDTRINARHSTHFVFSIKEKPSRKNIEILRSAMARVGLKHFEAEGYDYIFVIHTNTPHLHAHLVLHNKNIITGKKIRLSRYASLFALRKDFADRLREKGLNYTCSSRQDSMAVISGLETSKQTQDQNYLLNQIEKELGTDARAWAKKQFINRNSENDKKAEDAKANLKLIKKWDDPAAQAELFKHVNLYRRQKEKWQIKQKLQNKYKKIDKKDINAYVDSLFATEKRISDSYNSKNKRSVSNYQEIQDRISDLTKTDVSTRIIDFKTYKERRDQREKQIKSFELFGEVGKQYLRNLFHNLDYSKTERQREVVQAKIQDLLSGKVSSEEFDFFRHSLFESGSKEYQTFYDTRLGSIRQQIAEKANVKTGDVDQVERIFEIYCARRATDSVFAYRQFKRGIKRYTEILKSKDSTRLWQITNAITQKLGHSPTQQKMRVQKTAGFG